MSHFNYKKRSALLLTLSLFLLTMSLCFVRASHRVDSCAIPSFSGPANITVTAPRAIVVGDFNKDGKLDLAAANNRTSGTVSILLGNGNGGFSAPTNFSGGRMPTFLAAGDLNGDGNTDLVIANESNTQGEVSILLGNGTGGFGQQTFIRIINGSQNQTTAVAIGDFNGDGKADLVLVSATFNGVFVLLGDGTGQFTFFKAFSSGGFSPTDVVLADLNGDGKTDLVIANLFGANQGPSNVATLLGDGAGNFSPATTFAVGTSPTSLAVGDFNGDGKSDLAVANIGSNNVSILLGDGAGNFSAATNYDARGNGTQSVVQGDFNSDGKIDLAVFNAQPGNVVIFLGDGAGVFNPVAAYPAGPQAISAAGGAATADFNGDGRLDLAAVTELPGVVSVLLNTCGSSTAAQIQLTGNSYFASESGAMGANGSAVVTVTRTGDITGSASVDYATSNGTAIAPQDYIAASGTLNFAPGETFKTITITLINDNITENTETFNLTLSNVTGAATLGSPSTAPVSIFDDDPAPDISIGDATVNEGNTGTTTVLFPVTLSHPSAFTITVNHATADGSATAGPDYQAASGTLTFNPGEVSKSIAVTVNGDTLEEISETFFVNLSSPINAAIADAQGVGTIIDDDSSCPSPSFTGATNVSVGSGPFSLVEADFNNDGKLDLASANLFSNNVSVLLGNGSGGFSSPTNITVGSGPRSIASGDFNLDGKLDLVTANFGSSGDSSSVSILLGDGAGGFAPPITTNPVPGCVAVAVGDLNLDGKPDLAVVSVNGGTVSVLLGNGSGAFATPVNYPVGTSPLSVALGYFDNDGKLDMVVANLNSNNVSVLLGNGDGSFTPSVNFAVGANPQTVAVGDFNGDGKADLAVANLTSKDVSILLGDGAGRFAAATSVGVAHSANSVTVADLNADGKLDLAVPNSDDQFANGSLSVIFGNGAGVFSTPTQYTVGHNPISAVAGDFSGDGKLDLAVVNVRSDNGSVILNTCGGASPATLQFNAPTYNVNEGAGSVSITLTRSGNTAGVATVDYATHDGSASQRTDYTVASGTLTFLSGEMSKTFTVLIADDLYVEGTEVMILGLSHTTGTAAVLGSQNTASLIVNDNDGVQPVTNPLDDSDAQFFVRQHYSDFLSRIPDPSGFSFWTAQITQCGSDQACIRTKRIDVSNAFFYELEYQQTGSYVERLYRAAFGNNQPFPNPIPDPSHPGEEKKVVAYQAFVQDRARVVGGANLAQAQLDLANAFVQRPEFLTKYAASLDGPGFVEAILATIKNDIGADLTSQRQALIDLYNQAGGGNAGGGNVLYRLADDNAQTNPINNRSFIDAEYNRAFVATQYFGYLRRDADMAGFLFWLGQVSSAPLRDVPKQHAMVCSFITSAEYQQRFSPVVTHTNAECPR